MQRGQNKAKKGVREVHSVMSCVGILIYYFRGGGGGEKSGFSLYRHRGICAPLERAVCGLGKIKTAELSILFIHILCTTAP
jgi:hypothetical protein